MPKTILAIGAHYDDCVFGVPGVLLQAVQKEHRVVVLSLIGDYTNWPPVKGRDKELMEVSQSLAHYLGIEMRFLDFASGRFHLNEETKLATAVQGFPVSFSIAGKQYIGVTTGKGGGSPWGVPNVVTPEINPPNEGYALYVFALPDKK